MSGAKPEALKTVIKCVCVEHNWSLSDNRPALAKCGLVVSVALLQL